MEDTQSLNSKTSSNNNTKSQKSSKDQASDKKVIKVLKNAVKEYKEKAE